MMYSKGYITPKHGGRRMAGTNEQRPRNIINKTSACMEVRKMQGEANKESEQTGNKIDDALYGFPIIQVGQRLSDSGLACEHHLLLGLAHVEPGPHGDNDIKSNHYKTLNLRVVSIRR